MLLVGITARRVGLLLFFSAINPSSRSLALRSVSQSREGERYIKTDARVSARPRVRAGTFRALISLIRRSMFLVASAGAPTRPGIFDVNDYKVTSGYSALIG